MRHFHIEMSIPCPCVTLCYPLCMTGCAPAYLTSKFIERSAFSKRKTRNSNMLRIPLFCTSTNSLRCFLAHTERAQHLSAENGQHCPLQIRHLNLDSALLVAKGPSNIERRSFGVSCNQSSTKRIR